MAATRKKIASLMLGLPAPLRALRKVPVLGNLIHFLSHVILPGDEKVWARVERGSGQGLWLELNARTGQQYLRGDVEPLIQQVLSERLKPGMVFFDLGANIGFFTLLAARLVGVSGKVFSFEPEPGNAERLRRNIERNDFNNVTVIEAGVWSASGYVNFVAGDPSSPDHGIGKFQSGEAAVLGTPTRCLALDDFVRSEPYPDVIKCDVEGAEIEVFHGAENLLAARHPTIVCEIHSEKNDRSIREYFRRLGYRLDYVDEMHVLAVPEPVKQ
jgi:FkbM family methyltransferase